MSGYDSRFLVPIRGSAYIDDFSLESLKKFNVVILSNYAYREADRARMLLEDYVKDGGGLIIENGDINAFVAADVSPVDAANKVVSQYWNFTYVSDAVADWVDFAYFSAPGEYWVTSDQNVQPWASAMLRSHDYPTVVVGEYGKGRVVYDGLRISHRVAVSKNQMESFFFTKLVEWAGNTEEKASFERVIGSESVEDWIIYFGGRETNGSLKLSSNVTREGQSTLELGYGFDPSVRGGEYIEYKYYPSEVWDWRNMKFLSFWVYGDNSTNQLKIAILAPDWDNSFQLSVQLDWLGWRKVIIPLSGFTVTGLPSLTNVLGVSFVIDEVAPDEAWHQIYLNEVSVLQLNEHKNDFSEDFSNPNPELFKLTLNHSSGVLFKESFFQNWFAYLVDKEGLSHDLDIYKAGPDFMYVFIPSDVTFPAELAFEYRGGQIEKMSYMISLLTLVTLIIYGLWEQFHKLSEFLVKHRKIINFMKKQQLRK